MFSEDNSVQVVPSSWVKRTDKLSAKCHDPEGVAEVKLKKILQTKRDDQDVIFTRMYNCTIFVTYGIYFYNIFSEN